MKEESERHMISQFVGREEDTTCFGVAVRPPPLFLS